mgnify:FL=1
MRIIVSVSAALGLTALLITPGQPNAAESGPSLKRCEAIMGVTRMKTEHVSEDVIGTNGEFNFNKLDCLLEWPGKFTETSQTEGFGALASGQPQAYGGASGPTTDRVRRTSSNEGESRDGGTGGNSDNAGRFVDVPVPATAWLLLVGWAAVTVLRRRGILGHK